MNSCACLRRVLDIWVDTATWCQVLLPGGARDHTQGFAYAKQAFCPPLFPALKICIEGARVTHFVACPSWASVKTFDLCAGSQVRQTVTNRFTELSPMKTEWGQKLLRLHNIDLSTSSPCYEAGPLSFLLPLMVLLLQIIPCSASADPSVLRNTANWWLHSIFRMLSYVCRLEIEMSRGYTYGIYGAFKSEINCQALIFNFLNQTLPEEGENLDWAYLSL